MSQASALAEFYDGAFEAFADAGIADAGTYTAPAGSPVSGTFLVSRNTEYFGSDSQVRSDGITIAVQIAEVGVPVRGGTFVIGSETFTVDRIQERDEKRVVCLVKVGT